MRNSTNARKIAEFLEQQLEALARHEFGNSPPPAVRVQLARMQRRMQCFAKQQANWRSQGWEIQLCEWTLSDEALLDT